jgi:hypothetical protein
MIRFRVLADARMYRRLSSLRIVRSEAASRRRLDSLRYIST